jgi:hypothetical protein
MQRCGFDENGRRESSAKGASAARRTYGE